MSTFDIFVDVSECEAFKAPYNIYFNPRPVSLPNFAAKADKENIPVISNANWGKVISPLPLYDAKAAALKAVDEKTCTACKKTKPFSDFMKQVGKLGLTSRCKSCTSAYAHNRRVEKIRLDNAPAATRRCAPAGCGKVKPASEFDRDLRTSSGLSTYYRKCIKARSKRRGASKKT